jgi:tetratricopeptide (TPR) repeat protein
MNFFVQQIVYYYSESGEIIPSEVLSVLAKPLGSLSQKEIETYNSVIGPAQYKIRAALLDRFRQLGNPMQEWSQQVNPYYRPIVEEIAAQVLGTENVANLPETVAPRVPYKPQKGKPESFIRRLSVPHISYRWVIAIVVIIVLIAAGGWSYYSSTEPSRMLNQVITEIENGEYQATLRHIDESREKYPDKSQTKKAEKLEPWAALGYAHELYASTRYGEAAYHFELASHEDDLELEALKGCAESYLAEAVVHSDNQEYEDGYECCESALDRAPQDYDINSLMTLRADILYNWGMQLKDQNMYAMSAIRFEKCYTEWPAGPLAQSARGHYVDMTVASNTNQPPNKNIASSGQIEVRIYNATMFKIRYFFSGPSSLYVDIDPNGTTTVFIPPGIYSRGYIADKGIFKFAAGTDLSDVRYGWNVTIPAPELVLNQGVGYDAALGRVVELVPTLPPELLACVEDLDYIEITDPALIQDLYGGYDPDRDTVGFTLNIPQEEVDRVIFHEWGHAYDDEYLDEEEKELYMELRGILQDTLWHNPDDYRGSVEEDFAEVFAVIFGNVKWINHTPFGPVINGDELKAFILKAAD